jgi:hypothetical protein
MPGSAPVRAPRGPGLLARRPATVLASAIGNRAMSRLIQPSRRVLARDLTGAYDNRNGQFTVNMIRSAKDDQHGLWGTIFFTPAVAAPDSGQIRLLQAVLIEDLEHHRVLQWRGPEAARNELMTGADDQARVQAGWFVDVVTKDLRSRDSGSDPEVSPYYTDYTQQDRVHQDGTKHGTAITAAQMKDFPKTAGNLRYSFETVAVGTDNDFVYGSLRWGFTVQSGQVSGEWARNEGLMSFTTQEAVRIFNEHYRNPGAISAPYPGDFPVGAGTGSKTG